MSAVALAEPVTARVLREKLHGADVRTIGHGDDLSAKAVIYDLPLGFGEESWLEALPETMLVWQIEGDFVRCEWGAARGRRSSSERALSLCLQGTPNRYRAGACKVVQFIIPPALLARVADGLGAARLGPGGLRDDLIFFDDPAMVDALDAFVARFHDAVAAPTRVEMEARSVLIVERLLTRHHDLSPGIRRGGLAGWQLRRTTEYLNVHLAADISLAELAALADLSPFHFCRAFKQSTGLPPHAWQCARRIERAQDLMAAHPCMGLTEVALAVGYESQAAFGVAFKRATGTTPGQWRREVVG